MTSATKKRQRSEEEEEEPSLSFQAENNNNNKAISEFLHQIDVIVETSSSTSRSTNDAAVQEVSQASAGLLRLKYIQRQVLDRIKETNEALVKKRKEAKKRTVLLQNLKCEETYLRLQVETDVATPHLDRICRMGAEHHKHTETKDLSVEKARNLILCGAEALSYEDPANHDQVMKMLHAEINSRGTLERDVNMAEKTLAATKKKALEKQGFLKDLPRKVERMEQASVPLQKFFDQSLLTSPTGTVHLIGTDRRKRLDLAQSLSAPLYTLFVQIQSHLDASPKDSMSLEVSAANKLATPTSDVDDNDDDAWFETDAQSLLLHIPLLQIPTDARNSSEKRVTIEFRYLPKLRIVTAKATGGQDKVDLSTLVVNLFPGDSGECTWSAENVKLENIQARLLGRPFHWCNFIAGIHLPVGRASTGQVVPLQLSTKAVCRELTRRVRAHVTLTHILKALEGRKPIPMHPLLEHEWKEDTQDCVTRVVGWAETEGRESTSKYERSFLAVIKRQKSTLNATATFDPTRYPSEPPTWSLLKGEENWGEKHGDMSSLEVGTTPLYDSALGKIENVVNADFGNLVKEDVEETYDWILAHQLGKIVQLWDESQRSSGSGEAGATGHGKFSGVAS